MVHTAPAMHLRHAVLLGFVVAACSTPPQTEWRRNGDTIEVLAAGEPFATVHAGTTPRPFVWPLFADGGIPVTRAFPMEKRAGEPHDHPHHQSLWIAHGDVDGFDFWHGKDHRERIELVDCESRGGSEVVIDCKYVWRVDDVRDVLLEKRTLRFSADDEVRTIRITSTFRAPGDRPVHFGDTKEGTFAVRVHPGLQVRGAEARGTLRNSNRETGAAVWGKQASWIWATGVVDGEAVELGFMEHPSNPGSPTRWHARDYGLLAANPFGQSDFTEGRSKGGMLLKPGEEMKFHYAIVLLSGSHDERTRHLLHQRFELGHAID